MFAPDLSDASSIALAVTPGAVGAFSAYVLHRVLVHERQLPALRQQLEDVRAAVVRLEDRLIDYLEGAHK